MSTDTIFNETTTELMLRNGSSATSPSTNDSTLINDSSLAILCQNFHLIVFLCIIFVLIVTANISVILQLSCSKKSQSRMSFFLLNLAYADLFVGIIIVTRDIIEKSCIPFGLGSIGCRLLSFIQGTISYNSSYVLVCVSIDRLYAIVRPMNVRVASSAFRYSLIIASWIISMTFASAQLYLRDIDTIRGMRICGNRSDVQNWNAYVYFLFISLYLVPLIVMTVSYVIIIVIIWRKGSMKIKDGLGSARHEKSRIRRLLSSKKFSSNVDDHQIESSIRDVRSLGVIPRAKIKTVKMTLVIVIAFTACWSPYFILTMMNTLGSIQDFFLVRVTSSLCYMNSLANPLIYWLFVTNFCLRFRENYGCRQLTRIKSTGDEENGRRCSMLEHRLSVGSGKYQRRRSEDYQRAHHQRITTPSAPLPRHTISRGPPPATASVLETKRVSQQQTSPASLPYGQQQQQHVQL